MKKGIQTGAFFVGGKGLEPSTPALSKQCSKPTELTTPVACKYRLQVYCMQILRCTPFLLQPFSIK